MAPAFMRDSLNAHFGGLHGAVRVLSIRLPPHPRDVEVMPFTKELSPRVGLFASFRKILRELKIPGKEATKIETLIIQFGTFGNRNLLRLGFSYSLNDFKFFYSGYKL